MAPDSVDRLFKTKCEKDSSIGKGHSAQALLEQNIPCKIEQHENLFPSQGLDSLPARTRIYSNVKEPEWGLDIPILPEAV